jgi:hypothetical protein
MNEIAISPYGKPLVDLYMSMPYRRSYFVLHIRRGYYIEGGGGPTFAARSLPEYISAFATRVLQSIPVCVKGKRA